MKKITLALLLAIFGMHVFAQDAESAPKKDAKKKHSIIRPGGCAPIYITTSTGINNNTGIIGFTFDLPVSKHVSIDAGPGTGTWGYKVYAGVKYYINPSRRGFAFGTGFTYCPGVYHDQHDLETIYGNTETVEYNKNPQANILFAAYKYWYLGKKYNRVYAELGWSQPLTRGDKITQVAGDPISSDTINGLGSSAPGGPILAFGVSFGVH